jgi:hypothetical protein
MNLFEIFFYQINKNALEFLGVYLNEVNLNHFEENISNIIPTPETFVPETVWHEMFASEPLTSEPLLEPLWNISDWQFIIMGFILLFAIIYLELLILNMNKPNSNETGRYRHICRGVSLNNKRCKRCVKNTVTCYQH